MKLRRVVVVILFITLLLILTKFIPVHKKSYDYISECYRPPSKLNYRAISLNTNPFTEYQDYTAFDGDKIELPSRFVCVPINIIQDYEESTYTVKLYVW